MNSYWFQKVSNDLNRPIYCLAKYRGARSGPHNCSICLLTCATDVEKLAFRSCTRRPPCRFYRRRNLLLCPPWSWLIFSRKKLDQVGFCSLFAGNWTRSTFLDVTSSADGYTWRQVVVVLVNFGRFSGQNRFQMAGMDPLVFTGLVTTYRGFGKNRTARTKKVVRFFPTLSGSFPCCPVFSNVSIFK